MSRAVVLGTWWGLLAFGVVLVLLGALGRRLASPGALGRALCRHWSSRALLLAGWLWLGVHFFAR